MAWFASGSRVCAIALVAFAGGVVAAPAAPAPPNRDPEQLWERFPLDDRRNEPGAATPGSGAPDEPLRPIEREVPTAAAGDAASSTSTELVLLAAAALLGAAVIVFRTGPRSRRERKPALHTGSPERVAVVDALGAAAPATPASVATSAGSMRERGRLADEAEQRPPPILAPDAPAIPLRIDADSSRTASGGSEPLTVTPTKEEGGHVTEIDVLKAKLAHGSKHANVRDEAEVELLKRKSATGADGAKSKDLKAPIDNGRLAPRDTLALKETLRDLDAPAIRAVEAATDDRPAERATAREARLARAARPKAWRASEWLRDQYIVIGWAALLIAAAVTLGVSATYVVFLMY